jgi:hypothetical protein
VTAAAPGRGGAGLRRRRAAAVTPRWASYRCLSMITKDPRTHMTGIFRDHGIGGCLVAIASPGAPNMPGPLTFRFDVVKLRY